MLKVQFRETQVQPLVSMAAEESPLGVLFAGSVSGILADVATHPLSTIKTRLQCTGAEVSKQHARTSFLTNFRNVLKEEGVGALYRGVGVR